MLLRLVIRLKQSEGELPVTLRQKLANEVTNSLPKNYLLLTHVTGYMLHVNEYTWVQLLSYICTAFDMAISFLRQSVS